MKRVWHFTTDVHIDIGCGPARSVALDLAYTISPARPASRYEPAEPAEAHIINTRLLAQDGQPLALPDWLRDLVEAHDGIYSALLEDWRAQIEIEGDEAADAKLEMRREAAE